MMRAIKKGLVLAGVLVALCVSWTGAWAQLATTTVQDTIYRADGTLAGGSVVITWGAFTTAAGTAIAPGTAAVTIGTGGSFTVALAPNAGSVPMGSYYTAVFHLNDGTLTKEYWSVPVTVAGSGPVKLAAVSTTVLPASVAMQTVTKAYVDNAIAAAQTGLATDAAPYVLKAGDTMTGPLNLPADPVSPTQAADMHYVDANVSAVAAGVAGKVALNPSATQVVSQPVGTQLETNNLNGSLYATPYLQSSGSDGISDALGSGNCANGCEVVAEATYPGTEPVPVSAMPRLAQVIDARGGSEAHTTVDPLPVYNSNESASLLVSNISTRSPVELGTTVSSYALQLSNNALTGGSNDYPEQLGSGIPYFKSTYGVESMTGTYNTQGQHVQLGNVVRCYGIGDCLAGGQFIVEDGGTRDSADEGAHPWDLQILEDSVAFAGTCASGCTTGSTQVSVAASAGTGTQGDGRFLIDKNPAKVITNGVLVGGSSGNGYLEQAVFTGTSFPVSTFLETASAAVAQANNLAPGTVTLPIATSGVPSGFATTTAGLPSTGVACLQETIRGIPDFEMAAYSVVDGTHLQLTLNRPHGTASAVGIGGLCGYGLEQTVDTAGAVRQVFPVLGSTSATTLYYAGGVTNVVGVNDETSSYLDESAGINSLTRTGNVVTVTTTGNLPDNWNGLSITVSGAADSSYNGTFTVTTVAANQFTYPQTGANSTSSGGNAGIVTGGFVLYPMAEVLSVYDAATKTVDGAMTLSANTVAWGSGDAVEEPHFYLEKVGADVEFVTQYQPRLTLRQSAGKSYQGRVTSNFYGWEISNAEAMTDYLGSGGTLTPPAAAYSALGTWQNVMEVQAGQNGLVRAHCNAHGCARWDSGYALFSLDSATGVDSLNFAPQSDTVAWNLGGASYSFSPSALTAATINVGTLNATTINGGVSAAAITSGTIAAARLPVFGPSGPTHAVGAVPDPGATAGATRFLREDGTWNVPAGGSGSGTSGSLAGGALGSAPYQSAANSTAFLASPTTSGHVFAYSWQPSGSAVAPVALDLATYLASPPPIGATTPSYAVFGSSAANVPLMVNSNDTTSCNPPTTFTNQMSLVGSMTAGMFYGFNQSINAACIGALQPGVKWLSLALQPIAGNVGVVTPATVLAGLVNTSASAMLSIGGGPGSTANIERWYSPSDTTTGYTWKLNGTTMELHRWSSSADGAAIVSISVAGAVTATSYAETLTTPATSSAACLVGQFTDDANYHYVCVATNTWKRVALTSF